MVAGLIAVGILSDGAGNVSLGPAGGAFRRLEQVVQPLLERGRTAQRFDQGCNVVRDEETVLPGIGFRVIVIDLARIEGGEPASVQARPHETGFGVQYILPILGRSHVLLVFFHMPEPQCYLGYAPVIIGIFQGLGYALMFVIGEHQAVATETAQPEIFPLRGCQQGLESLLIIKAFQSPGHRIGDDRRAVVSDHAVGLIAGEFPDRKFPAFPPDGEHGLDKVHGPVRLDFGQQRMQAAERIPKGKDRVALPAFGFVHLAVHAPVFAIDIGIEGRVDGRVVQGGVESGAMLLVFVRAGDFGQVSIPSFSCVLFQLFQRLGPVALQVVTGILPAD